MRTTKRSDVPFVKGSRCAWSAEPSEEEQLSQSGLPFQLSFLFLGSFGALPCTWKIPHLPSLHPTKSTVVIGIASSGAMFVCLYHAVTFLICRLLNEDLTLRVQILFSFYFALAVYSLTIVSLWVDSSTIRRVGLIAIGLSRLYFELTKKRLKMRLQMAEKIVLALSLIGPTLALSIVKETQPEVQITYEYVAPIAYLGTILFPLVFLWVGYCTFFALYAREINQEIAQCVQQNSLTSEKLQIYRKIWIQMRSYSDAISGVNTTFLILVVTLPTLVIGVFLLILHVQDGMYYTSVTLLIFCVIVSMLIGSLGACSDYLVGEVKVLYTSILSLQSLSSIDASGMQCQIINLYLLARLRPIKPSFSGVLFINKAVIPSMLSAVTINIVVLAQLTQPQISNGDT